MIELESLFLVILSFVGFVLKGLAGFGPGIVMVPVGALIFGAREMVLLSGCLDLVSNTILFKFNRERLFNGFWQGMLLSMTAGTCIGALLLSLLPAVYFDLVIGLLLVPVGLWTIFGRQKETGDRNSRYPDTISRKDLLICFATGCMSGLSGITAPLLAWYFNRHYTKTVFREIMIPLLLVSASVRVATYALSGVLNSTVLPLVLLSTPGLILGLWIGNHMFLRISQRWFGVVIGGLVTLSGIKLALR